MRARATPSLLVTVVGLAWVACFLYQLISPAQVLAGRDILFFHLPLRLSLSQLAHFAPPTWNPWIHGGQPVLSNPNYAAFYPPTWLNLVVSPAYSLSLIMILHMGLGFAGAYRLARRLGCAPESALLAALGFSGCGASISLVNAFNAFCGMAWLPWVLDASFRLIDPAVDPPAGTSAAAGRGRGVWLDAFRLAVVMTLQFLCGEPVLTMVSGLALACVALSTLRRRPSPLPALAAFALAGVFTVLLSAIQLLPTIGRLRDSPRASGVAEQEATTWSMPPVRFAEIVLPRALGDPARIEQGYYFGWGINDRDFPYVSSLYAGTLLALLAAAALLRGGIPLRWPWLAMIASSAMLALGRFNPLYPVLRKVLPVLGLVRFPEKFVVLAVAAIIFAGALGWQHLLAERREGRADKSDFVLALAVLLFAVTTGISLLLSFQPALASWFVHQHGARELSVANYAHSIHFLIKEGWIAVLTTGLTCVLLALLRFSRLSERQLSLLAITLLAADLWRYEHRLVRSAPAATFLKPPAIALALLPPRGRIFVQDGEPNEPELFQRIELAEIGVTTTLKLRLSPYSGLVWGLPYAFHQDYDLMETRWASRATLAAFRHQKDPELGLRYMGAWNVATVVVRKPVGAWVRELQRDPNASPILIAPNPYKLERFRFVPIVAFHQTYEKALAVALAQRYAFDRRDHLIRPNEPPVVIGYPVPPTLRSIEDRGSRVKVRYDAVKGACFVMAATFDKGWKAQVDGQAIETYPTAASQVAMLLPEGKDRLLTISYSDPQVTLGALISGTSLLAGIAGLLARRRARPATSSAAA